MANRNNLGNTPGDGDMAGRLSQMSDRTNLMIIDATLQTLPQGDTGYAAAAEDIRILARRMLQAAQDYRASLANGAVG